MKIKFDLEIYRRIVISINFIYITYCSTLLGIFTYMICKGIAFRFGEAPYSPLVIGLIVFTCITACLNILYNVLKSREKIVPKLRR